MTIAVQADGKILVGGGFNGANSIGGQARNYIARLDATTGLADSFDPNASGFGSNIGVYSIAVRVDSLAEVMRDWAATGIEWVLPAPQELPPNTPAGRYRPEKVRINWVKPSSLGGIMLEVFEFEGRVEHH